MGVLVKVCWSSVSSWLRGTTSSLVCQKTKTEIKGLCYWFKAIKGTLGNKVKERIQNGE